MKKGIVVYCAIAVFFAFLSASFAYETIPFRHGGSIEGTVEFSGDQIPTDPMLMVSSDKEYCGNSLPAQKYLIKGRKVQNVVVYIAGIKGGKEITREPVTVSNKKCQFVPHVGIGFKGNKLTVKTEDPVLHTFDVHASISGKELFHLSLHEKDTKVTKTIRSTGLLELSCYVHPWQHAYIFVFDHPYAAVTDENGRFMMNEIPPGTYTIETWHEALGTRKIADIKVESGKTSVITIKYPQ